MPKNQEQLTDNDFLSAFGVSPAPTSASTPSAQVSTSSSSPSAAHLDPDPKPDFSYLKTLNPEQKQAVKTVNGPLLVTAGAGSGKTRVLTSRIAYMIQHDQIAPDSILAITFTRKAANEMQERLAKLVSPDDANKVTMGTFHKICANILRAHAAAAGLNNSFTIADDTAQTTIIKTLIKRNNNFELIGKPKDLVSLISRFKDAMIVPETTALSNANVEPILNQFNISSNLILTVQELYRDYQNELNLENAVDFGDMINRTIDMFEHPRTQSFFGMTKKMDILSDYQNLYRYILIDEYQDTNPAQYRLIKLLAGKNQNVCAVGDADQSIYGWRGADISNIFNFKDDFAHAQEIKLQQNYRSTNNILAAASAVIHHNTQHTTEKLWSQNGSGNKLQVCVPDDVDEQTDQVVRIIKNLHDKQNKAYQSVGILYRSNRSANPLDRAFVRARIPHEIVKGQEFYKKAVVQNYLAYFTILTNPAQSTALQRIINRPSRRISPKVLDILSLWSGRHHQNLYEAVEHVDEINELSPSQQKSIKKFHTYVQRWQAFADNHYGPQGVKDTIRVMKKAFRTNALLNQPRKSMTEDDIREIENHFNKQELQAFRDSQRDPDAYPNVDKYDTHDQFMQELFDYAQTQVSSTLSAKEIIQKFLEDINLQIDDLKEAQDDSVQLMTVHTAKGLEFDTVILVDFNEETFPTARSIFNTHPKAIEEERRLAYVAYTRAKTNLIISTPLRRPNYAGVYKNVSPSRFIFETPLKYLDIHNVTLRHWEYLRHELERELGHEIK